MAYPKKQSAKSGGYSKNNQQSESANKYESKSHAEMQTVLPQNGDKFDAFQKIFAWKTTKRFGFISLQAYKNKEQKIQSGEAVAVGYEKWYCKVKTGISESTVSALYNIKKKILFFELGNQKCAVSPSKGYFSFLMPEAVKNAKLRR
jgi:hypothetical protein